MEKHWNEAVEFHREAVKKHFERPIFYCGLYGSQNYELDTPDSDVDTKTMIVPSAREVILGKKMVSTDLKVGDALSNVKDLRAMFDNFYKGNINFVEILFTPYWTCDISYYQEAYELRCHRDHIANRDPLKLMEMAAGMARQKYVAFDKPFESKKEVLAKYGYDPKQLHHLVRLYYFMTAYLKYEDFGASLVPAEHDYIMGFKTFPLRHADAVVVRDEYMAKVDNLLAHARQRYSTAEWQNEITNRSHYVREYLDNLAVKVLSKGLRAELT